LENRRPARPGGQLAPNIAIIHILSVQENILFWLSHLAHISCTIVLNRRFLHFLYPPEQPGLDWASRVPFSVAPALFLLAR
jgi:hypothetical protein